MRLERFDEAAQSTFQEAQEIMHNCSHMYLDEEQLPL
jgi:hypothetical protein